MLFRSADGVAAKIDDVARTRGLDIEIVRNGSRGMLWLEPFVEVETERGRIGYGPVAAEDVVGLIDAGMLIGEAHPLCHGIVDEIPWLARQQRVTFARVGLSDPLDLDEYRATGGLVGLERAARMDPSDVVAEVLASGLREIGRAHV